MASVQTRPRCIYCGGDARKVGKGEHVVQYAIGGARTISETCRGRAVCKTCNNGVLSDLDREFCSLSPISIIAAQELGGFVSHTWDVDHTAANLLLEARPDFTGQSMTLYPQMIFESAGPEIRGDHEEIQRFGVKQFEQVFVRHMLHAFRAFEGGKRNRLNLKRTRADAPLFDQYRYPPRIFSRRRIDEFKQGMSFELQYRFAADRRFALSQLESWNPANSFRKFEVAKGSALPAVGCSFDAGKALRAMYKVAVNLLAAYCPTTPVSRDAFPRVVRVVTGELPVPPSLLRANGFVRALDVAALKGPDNAHTFRLLHADGFWNVYASYFGGRIGTFVRFPGPNRESWNCADVRTPLQSKKWSINCSRLLQPLRVHICWTDYTKLMPSVDLINTTSALHIVPA